MKLPRRQFLYLAAGAAAVSAVARIAGAQAYPTRPVRIIVGYPPGGSADVVARLIGQQLSERLGQPFVVENRPGAGTNIATESVVKSAPDGYTLLVVDASPAINTTHKLREVTTAAKFFGLSATDFNWVPEQAFPLCLNRLMALTGTFSQSLHIDHPDMAAPITDETSLLQGAGHNRHAGTTGT
jgi:Tripartite tricarboxylate transporter family receptor